MSVLSEFMARDVGGGLVEEAVSLVLDEIDELLPSPDASVQVSGSQRFLSVHGVIQDLFNLGCYRLRSENYRLLRGRSSKAWSAARAA